jgi:hypothetical protein
MPYTTISIKEGTKKELRRFKEIYETKSMDDLLRILITQEKKRRIDEFSDDFRKRLKEKNLTLEDIIKSGEEIRAEILKERKIV